MPVAASEHSSSSWFCLPGPERLGDRPAYQHWQSKHACGDQNKRLALQEQEEGRTARGTEGPSNFPVIPDEDLKENVSPPVHKHLRGWLE